MMALPRSLATSLLGRQSPLLSTQLHANSAACLVGGPPITRAFASESGEETFDFEVRALLITIIKGASQPALLTVTHPQLSYPSVSSIVLL